MTVYVAEILGRGIAAFNVANDSEAEARLKDKELLRDLIVLQNEGRPLWDGTSEVLVRLASAKEAEKWAACEIESEDERQHVFLVSVIDPSDDRFDNLDQDIDHDND